MSQEVDKEKLVSSLWGAERCLRVLESVSVAAIGKIFALQQPQQVFVRLLSCKCTLVF